MVVPILIGVGVIGVGGWIYHHLFLHKVSARVTELEAKTHKHH